ncbi:hypothetical protein QTP88_026986 [Uroleucon formosanum]
MVLHVNDTREMRVKPATAIVLMKRDRTPTVVGGSGGAGGGEMAYEGVAEVEGTPAVRGYAWMPAPPVPPKHRSPTIDLADCDSNIVVSDSLGDDGINYISRVSDGCSGAEAPE